MGEDSLADNSNIAAGLLASGQSRRFGDTDKLTQLLHGKMLGLHVADTLASFNFKKHFVVVASANHPCISRWQELGFEIIVNDRAAEGQSTSVHSMILAATKCGAEGLMICLADMPLVGFKHISALCDAWGPKGTDNIVASSDRGQPMPPVIFGKRYFDQLERLKGDQGARNLLKNAQLIEAEEGDLINVNTPEELANLL